MNITKTTNMCSKRTACHYTVVILLVCVDYRSPHYTLSVGMHPSTSAFLFYQMLLTVNKGWWEKIF
jgi:hypothetical protein